MVMVVGINMGMVMEMEMGRRVDDKFYTGFSSDLTKRIEEHNLGKVQSTKNRIPLELVYYEVCFCIDDATHREKYLKTTYGKRFIKNQIKSYLEKF